MVKSLAEFPLISPLRLGICSLINGVVIELQRLKKNETDTPTVVVSYAISRRCSRNNLGMNTINDYRRRGSYSGHVKATQGARTAKILQEL